MLTVGRDCALSVALGLFLISGCGAIDNSDGGNPGVVPGSDGGPEDDGEVGVLSTTVEAIRRGEVSDSSLVKLQGLVVTSGFTKGSNPGFFVQQGAPGPHTGIFVFARYVYDEIVASIRPGVAVSLTGTYVEWYGQSQISLSVASDLQVEGVAAVPEPVDVEPADIMTGGAKAEEYEGVLVRVSDVSVTQGTDRYGEFQVADGLRIDDAFLQEAPDAAVGTQLSAIVGLLMYAFDEHKMAPRSQDDLVGYAPPEPEPEGDVTIYELRAGAVAESSRVTVAAAVVTTPVNSDKGALVVQDAAGGQFSGIYLYLHDAVVEAHAALAPGDVVRVSGEYVEYYGMSEIVVSAAADLEVVGTGAAPEPEVVQASDVATGGPLAEAYESVVITVQDTRVLEADLGYSEFSVTGGLRVDDWFFSYSMPEADTVFSRLTGPLLFSYDNTKLAPRGEADMVRSAQDVDE